MATAPQPRTEFLVGGAWQTRETTAPVTDPSDGSVITEISVADVADCRAAVDAAAAAYPDLAARPARERSEMLRALFEATTARSDELAELISRENGKVLADARAEMSYAAEFFRWFAEEAVRIAGELRRAPAGNRTIMVVREPVGVSVLITPWNFPAAMLTRKIGPALAAGCPVVIKPAMETPLTALALGEICQEVGIPAGVINIVTPDDPGPAVGAMLDDPRVRNLSFTGSTATGRVLLKQAADRVLRTSMELGGNAPFLVTADADVTEAVKIAMVAKMRNGGAACTAANRFYVAREVVDAFTDQLTKAMRALQLGPGLDPASGLGASVSLAERDKVARLVEQAVAAGADVRTGGTVPDGPGAFYPATVLRLDADNPILAEEIFGPVAPVVAVDSDEEALRLANGTEAGLISYVVSGDRGHGVQLARGIESGMVAVNQGVISDPAAPFGGYKQSGLGREGGFDGIAEFTETKYIGVDL